MTKKDRAIVSTMWGNRGMKGYTTNRGGGYCNLLRGNFDNTEIRESFKPRERKSYVKQHRKQRKPQSWDLTGYRMVSFG
jgi:hypothetical protein